MAVRSWPKARLRRVRGVSLKAGLFGPEEVLRTGGQRMVIERTVNVNRGLKHTMRCYCCHSGELLGRTWFGFEERILGFQRTIDAAGSVGASDYL